MAVLAAAAIIPQPAASDTMGNGSLTASITYSPDPIHVGDTVNIAVLLTNTLNTSLNVDYFIYAGWSYRIVSGTIQITAGANVSLTAQWLPSQQDAGVPYFPLGINVSDNATGNMLLCEYKSVDILAGGLNPLTAAVSVSPASVHVNDDVTVTVKLCNTGTGMLYEIHYVIYAGLGNYIASGNVPQLWPAAICQSVPGGGEVLKAYWRPAAPGTYKVGINASDGNGTGAVVKSADVVVSGAIPSGFALAVSPTSVTIEPGTSFNIAASVTYTTGTTEAVTTKNTQIISPPGGSFVRGTVTMTVYVQTCNCTGVTELYADGAFHSNGTRPPVTMVELNGTYFEVFEHHWDSSAASTGWHNLTVLGKHKEFCDTVFVLVNGSCDLWAAGCPAGWTHTGDCNFTPVDNGPITATMTFGVPADSQNGTYSIHLDITGPYDKILAEALVTVIVVNGTSPAILADLSVAGADISLLPDPATEGMACTLQATVRNIGSIPGTGVVRISDNNDTPIGSQNISLASAEMVNLSFPWSPSAGNYTIEVTVQTLSGGNRETFNDRATRTFYILPAVSPPVPRLLLQLEKDSVTISPGGAVLVNVHVICADAEALGVLLRAAPSDGFLMEVELLSPPPIVLAPGENWTSQIRLRAPMAIGNHSHNGTVRISLMGSGVAGDTKDLDVRIVEVAPARTESPMVAIGAAAAVSIVVIAAIAVGWTEVGLVALTSLLLPLYSKIRKDEVLDQFTRGKIQGYITAYPGEHYNSIKAQLGIKNGALAYHLKVLEREGYVTSVRDGVYKRFYPKETILPGRMGQFSQMQEMILGHLREAPGICQDGLARRMKVSNQVIYYHIRNLMAAGAVRLEKDGKETHCYLNGFEGTGYRGPGAG